MPPASDKLREIARKRIKAALAVSKHFTAASPQVLEDYVQRLDVAMFAKYGKDADDFKDQTSDIIKSLKPYDAAATIAASAEDPNYQVIPFIDEVHTVAPEVLAVMAAEDMVSKTTYAHRSVEQDKRERVNEILPENDFSTTAVAGGGAITCHICGKVRLAIVNMNRCGLDDKTFENNFEDNRCECTEQQQREASEKEKKEGATIPSKDSSNKTSISSNNNNNGDSGFLMPGVPASFSKMVSGSQEATTPTTTTSTAGSKRPREE